MIFSIKNVNSLVTRNLSEVTSNKKGTISEVHSHATKTHYVLIVQANEGMSKTVRWY